MKARSIKKTPSLKKNLLCPYNIYDPNKGALFLSDTTFIAVFDPIFIDFYVKRGYNTIHNHGFGGSIKKSYRGDRKVVMKKVSVNVPKQQL